MRAAHPRSRGEHYAGAVATKYPGGSSPLARGTPRAESKECGRRGLIPARAGNTYRAAGRNRRASAHPRSRGEHETVRVASPQVYGSSPLARGTLTPRDYPVRWVRLIPARAGNTEESMGEMSKASAHPRSRGEHGGWYKTGVLGRGSSPLARGTLSLPFAQNITERLIPARAGNTSVWVVRFPAVPAHPRSRGEHIR